MCYYLKMAKAPRIGELTPKQAKFATIVLKQIKEDGSPNYSKAVMESYDVKNINSASSIAADNLQNITIREQVQKALSKQGLTLDKIVGNLDYFASAKPESVSADSAIRANVELLKLQDAYPGTKNTQVSLSVHANLKDMKFQDLQKEVAVIDAEVEELMGNVRVDNLSTSEE